MKEDSNTKSLLILTKKEADSILNAPNKKEGTISLSLDLGQSQSLTAVIVKDGFALIENQKIAIEEFSKVKEKACYVVEDNTLKIAAFFSDETNFYYKLVPTSDWPTLTLSSTPMHRHTRIMPKQDSLLKIKEISPVKGRVLDTCCGLGYTAILSSKEADEVYTFERDKYVLNIASYNPYSQEIFHNKKIKLFEKDIFNEITCFEDNFFDRIIHDPPTFKYSPLLYSSKFYLELFRVLKKGGIIYHYSPCPKKTKGNIFYKGLMKKLNECGFQKVEYHAASSGIRAVKFF